jgi:amidase
MTSEPVHYLSLIDVSARLRSGDLKPTTLTEMILARIAQYDGALKSYTTLLADRAMAKAREAEAELNRGFWRGPLHGVPIAVKDLCYTDYAPTAAGCSSIRTSFRLTPAPWWSALNAPGRSSLASCR